MECWCHHLCSALRVCYPVLVVVVFVVVVVICCIMIVNDCWCGVWVCCCVMWATGFLHSMHQVSQLCSKKLFTQTMIFQVSDRQTNRQQANRHDTTWQREEIRASECHHVSVATATANRTFVFFLWCIPHTHHSDPDTCTLAEPEWNYISDTAKDFIRNLLVLEPSKRLTVEQCLAHPFLAGSAGTQMLNIEKSMSKYNVQRKKAKNQVDEQ